MIWIHVSSNESSVRFYDGISLIHLVLQLHIIANVKMISITPNNHDIANSNINSSKSLISPFNTISLNVLNVKIIKNSVEHNIGIIIILITFNKL